jgi:hypothetical protein
MLTFARYWQARERLQWRFESREKRGLQLQITAPLPIEGATFYLGGEVAEATGIAGLKVSGKQLVLPALAAGQTVTVNVRLR